MECLRYSRDPLRATLERFHGEITTTHGLKADTEAELAAWRELLPDLRGSGPYRARCPLHEDGRKSFSVFPGQADGRLIGRCHADCGTWTLRLLRYRLSRRRVAQYTRAHESITALGDSIDHEVREALRWIVGQAERWGLDLADSEGIGASYRQLARATDVNDVSEDGRLSNGRAVVRLLDRLRALGVYVILGQQYTPDGGGGSATRLVLPIMSRP